MILNHPSSKSDSPCWGLQLFEEGRDEKASTPKDREASLAVLQLAMHQRKKRGCGPPRCNCACLKNETEVLKKKKRGIWEGEGDSFIDYGAALALGQHNCTRPLQ